MGNVASRADETSPLLIRDQNRLSVTSVKITNARNRVLYKITPNGFPATRYIVKREPEEEAVVEYIQDPEGITGAPPSFLLRLNNDEDIFFYFTFTMRQGAAPLSIAGPGSTAPNSTLDTIINSLTFIFASTPRDLDTLVTREFNADPNLHKNPNVDLVGDYTTAGNPLEQFEWSWKWRPPKMERDKGGGWRNTCSFVEYDSRAHRLNTLVSFSFWVHHTRLIGSPKSPSPRIELTVPSRLRVPSAQSIESRMSDSDTEAAIFREPQSPIEPIPEYGLGLEPIATNNPVKVDITCQRPGEDISAVEDGPLFRATMKALEQKTGNMRARMKKVLKKAEAAKETQVICNASIAAFMEALHEASSSNANAVQPALDHYFEKIATEILSYEKQQAINLQKLIIDPISRLYSNDIKQAESKKKDFDEESRDYYAYVSRYLGQRQDSLKEKKRAESDSKYDNKRKTFELKRFDYSSFMQDLHGGRKDQEVLSQLTKYAETQAQGYLATAKKIEAMVPQLEALCFEVKEADKEYQLLRTGREEKRRALEKSSKPYNESETTAMMIVPTTPSIGRPGISESDFGQSTGLSPPSNTRERPKSVGPVAPNGTLLSANQDGILSASPRSQSGFTTSPAQNKFKGIRDLEEKDRTPGGLAGIDETQYRKEGLLWSMSRPGSHADPKGLNKQAWHKFWIVLDQGKLSEYVNWKQNLEPHRDPIDLRMASVREARNAERRFCFEVITPSFTRVYQAPTEDEMKAWIQAINNALQGAFEGKAPPPELASGNKSTGSIGRDLFGKSSSFSGHRSISTSSAHLAAKNVSRHATVGERPPISRSRSSEERPARLLQSIRDADAGNAWCADCNTDSRVEWVSINLGIIICIECSGIHRSLGTHISKVRSLTLDPASFTQDITELLLQIGNRVSNMIWEATLDRSVGSTIKPTPNSTRDHRLRYITAKYVERAFVNPLYAVPGRSNTTPDDLLLASIKRNDIQNVLYALAVHANPNAADRSRATHAVFLALAAADPAAPASMQANAASPSSSSKISAEGAGGQQTQQRKSFSVAELLLQNGAEVPSQMPTILLSAAARTYLDFKRDQKLGIVRGRGEAGPGPAVVGFVGGSGSGSAPAGFSSPVGGRGGAALAPLPLLREAREARDSGDGDGRLRDLNLVKRSSAGGRLIKGTGIG